MPEELGPKAPAAMFDLRSIESLKALAAHAPYTPESGKYKVLELVKRLWLEND